MNAGIARISNTFLEKMLGLPEGHRVLHVLPSKEHTFNSQLDFDILIEGPDLPLMREGETYSLVTLEADEERPPFKSRIVK